MPRQALDRVVLIVGAIAAVAYPALDLLTGRGPQWTWLTAGYPVLAFFLAGTYVFIKRPDHPVAGRLLLLSSSIIVTATLGQLISDTYLLAGPQTWFWIALLLQQVTETAALVGILGVFAVFPDGRYQRGYERWTVRIVAVMPVLIPLLMQLAQSPITVNPFFVPAGPPITSPLHMDALGGLGRLAAALYIGRLSFVLIAAVLLVLRYRRFDAERKLQSRWPLFSLLFVIPFGMGPVGYLIGLSDLLPAGNNLAPVVVIPTLPISLAIGLLHPHLLDLELVIRRSVVYAALWLLIALAYIAIAMQIGVETAQRAEVGVVVLVTIFATLAFQPARAALERLAARLVYGERLTGYQAVSRLGMDLVDTADPEDAAALLAATVRQALDARWARVVIEGATPTVATDGPAGDAAAALSTPLVHGAEVIGRVDCGPRTEGRYRQRDRELLITLGRQTTQTFRNARLASELAGRLEVINAQAGELQASRTRIVQAEEAGRRRLERDIHDGVQQELVALLAKIRLARNQVGRDPAAVGALLEELQEETRLALTDLRDLAQGVHPTVLSDRGLVEAIEDRVSRMPARVIVDASPQLRDARFPPAVEGAAYFTVCEGLANAMKHASARQLVVGLRCDDRELSIEVSDDGTGFDAGVITRSGLRGLADRIEALGGLLRVTSVPGHGTQLLATLPARAAVRA